MGAVNKNAKIEKKSMLKRIGQRLGQILGPDIEEKDELNIQERDELTQEQKDFLKEGMREAEMKEKAFEDFQRRIKISEKDDKIVVNNNTVKDVSKDNKEQAKEENFDIDMGQ